MLVTIQNNTQSSVRLEQKFQVYTTLRVTGARSALAVFCRTVKCQRDEVTRQEDWSSGGRTWFELKTAPGLGFSVHLPCALVGCSQSAPRSPLVPSPLVARAAQGGQAHGMVNKWTAAAGQVQWATGQPPSTTGHHRQPTTAGRRKSRVPLHFPTAHFLPSLPSTSRRAEATASHWAPPCPSSVLQQPAAKARLALPCLPLHFPKFPVVCFVLMQENGQTE